MRRFVIAWFVLSVCILAGLSIAYGQGQPPKPQIISFTSDLASITPDEAESGLAVTVLAWQTRDLGPYDWLDIQILVLGEWRSVTTQDDNLPAVGWDEFTVPHTLDFQPPTWRLLILNAEGRIVDEAVLTIPYVAEPDTSGEIVAFSALVTEVNINELDRRTARIPVTWQVRHRPPDSNLRFQQTTPAGTEVLVELPRQFPWVPSQGEGMVAPRLLDTKPGLVWLRLQVFDIRTGAIHAEETITLTITGRLNAPVESPPAEATAVWAPDTPCTEPFFFQTAGAEYVFAGGGFLNAQPFVLCPSTGVGTTKGVFQVFENGYMLYRSDTNTVYILSINAFALSFPNTYVNDEPLNFPTSPPAGTLAPQGVLGKAWIEHHDVAQFIGWAVSPAEEYTLTYQETYSGTPAGTVMTLPGGGRFFVTFGVYGGTPPVWAFINQVN